MTQPKLTHVEGTAHGLATLEAVIAYQAALRIRAIEVREDYLRRAEANADNPYLTSIFTSMADKWQGRVEHLTFCLEGTEHIFPDMALLKHSAPPEPTEP